MTTEQPNQSPIVVMPATAEHWADIEELFAQTPCWCQSWRVSASEYGRSSKDELGKLLEKRRNALRAQLEHTPPPGVIAYLDETIVGWCGFWPRQKLQRLVHSRTIPAVDDRPVWAIVCFLVRTGYRRARGGAGAASAVQSNAPALTEHRRSKRTRSIRTASASIQPLPMSAPRQCSSGRVSTGLWKQLLRSAGLPRWLMRLEL